MAKIAAPRRIDRHSAIFTISALIVFSVSSVSSVVESAKDQQYGNGNNLSAIRRDSLRGSPPSRRHARIPCCQGVARRSRWVRSHILWRSDSKTCFDRRAPGRPDGMGDHADAGRRCLESRGERRLEQGTRSIFRQPRDVRSGARVESRQRLDRKADPGSARRCPHTRRASSSKERSGR